MKIAPIACVAPRLEIYHPRTVHIFSRGWSMNKRNTTTDTSAFASVAQRPRREAFHFGPTFPGVTSALKRRRTSGYSPTTAPGWYGHSRVLVSLREIGLMCTFLKNRVRLVSRVACLTCTRNLAHATLCPKKWCITTYTDVCITDSVRPLHRYIHPPVHLGRTASYLTWLNCGNHSRLRSIISRNIDRAVEIDFTSGSVAR